MVRSLDAGEDRFHGCLGDVAMADLRHRRFLAAAHARRPHHPHGVARRAGECVQQCRGAETLAGEAVADPDRERRGRALALHDDVEVGVEGRDLVDLGHGEAHLGRQRREVPGREAAVVVLDPVQMLDQQIAAPGRIAQQSTDFFLRRGIDLPALLGIARSATPAAGVSGCLSSARKCHLRTPNGPARR